MKVPRDRNGEFEPKLVRRHARRLEGFNDIELSLVSRGMTTRDVRSHLAVAYKVEVSPELISKITDAVLPELRAWQARPLDAMYPIVYLEAIVVKIPGRLVTRPSGAQPRQARAGLAARQWRLGRQTIWLGILTELRTAIKSERRDQHPLMTNGYECRAFREERDRVGPTGGWRPSGGAATAPAHALPSPRSVRSSRLRCTTLVVIGPSLAGVLTDSVANSAAISKLAISRIAVMLGRNKYAAALVVRKLEKPLTSTGGVPLAEG